MLELEPAVHKVLGLVELDEGLVGLSLRRAFLFDGFAVVVACERRLFGGFLFGGRFVVGGGVFHEDFGLANLFVFEELVSTLDYGGTLLFGFVGSVDVSVSRVCGCLFFKHFCLGIDVVCSSFFLDVHLFTLDYVC